MCFDALFILPWLLIVRAEGIVKRERGRKRGRFGHRSGSRARSQPHTHTVSVSQQAFTHIHFNISLPMAQMDSAMCANCVPRRESHHTHTGALLSHTRKTQKAESKFSCDYFLHATEVIGILLKM